MDIDSMHSVLPFLITQSFSPSPPLTLTERKHQAEVVHLSPAAER